MSWIYGVPFLGALALGAGTILQKTILKRKKIDTKFFLIAEFVTICLVMLPFIFFFWKLEPQALTVTNIFIFFLVVLFSIIANLFVYYSMKWEKVTKLEPAKILEPLFVIILAIIFGFFFGEELFERNTKVIIPALLAGVALVFSHIKKHHLTFNKYFIAAIFGSLFFALELVLSRLILDFYSPISFYFLRSLFVLVISYVIFMPHLMKLNKKVEREIFALGAIWVLFRVLVYYGYIHLGVIFTTLMIMLGPIFIYLFAWKFLKEKLDWRNIVAAVIIIGSVLYAILG